MSEQSTEHAGKTGTNKLFAGKRKWYWVGGLVVIAFVYFYIRQRNQNTSGSTGQTGTGSATPIDPATGYPQGSAADLAALGYSGSTQSVPSGTIGGGISNGGGGISGGGTSGGGTVNGSGGTTDTSGGISGTIDTSGSSSNLGGSGTAGPAGPAGPRGPRGPRGPSGHGFNPPTNNTHRNSTPTHKGNTYYTVKPGDTLSGIARKLGISDWHVLYNANKGVVGSNPNFITPGERLVVPA